MRTNIHTNQARSPEEKQARLERVHQLVLAGDVISRACKRVGVGERRYREWRKNR